ncbi:MAG: glycosyltransferase [Thermoplasmata archaeon]|jgi:glycosyltransferase involved in cell wall biosynthesis
MKRILFITDPVGGLVSVQLNLLKAIGKNLESQYRLAMFTPHCGEDRATILEQTGFELFVSPNRSFALNRILGRVGRSNESMLWAESWLREVLYHWNHQDAEKALRDERFDFVVNMSSTVAFPCDLWWTLGTPLDQTIRGMASTNVIAKLTDILASRTIAHLDRKLVGQIAGGADHIVANSPFLADLYRARNVKVDGVVYCTKDFSAFRPTASGAQRDYVLLYVGKEIDHFDFRVLRDAGVRVVGFGAKVPTGTRFWKFADCVDFRGRVSETELVDLYSNALFTLFPFSLEPFGWVPIESMACGTPVLTYDRQGPATTVVDGRTGWLVHSAGEMARKATEIWRRRTTNMSSADCVHRAGEFSIRKSVSQLVGWIERPALT